MPFLMLIRNLPNVSYTEVSGEPHDGLKPWGLTEDNQIIFSAKSAPLPPGNSPYSLSRMDQNQNLARRTAFESELAALLRQKHMWYMDVVRKVSGVIDTWIGDRLNEDPPTSSTLIRQEDDEDEDETLGDMIAEVIKNYMYARPSGDRFLGMIDLQDNAPNTTAGLIAAGREVLAGGFNLDQQLNFHRTFVTHLVDNASIEDRRNELQKSQDSLQQAFEQYRRQIQPHEKYVQPSVVQRVTKPGKTLPTTTLGIRDDPQIPFDPPLPEHTRALDKYGRPSTQTVEHPFEQNANKHSMPFVGGPSASAAELFICAAIAQLNEQEMARYALAVVAFMVGGGMHSFHEIMKSAKKSKKKPNEKPRAGIPYVSGNYESALPPQVLQDRTYKELRKRYSDLHSLPNLMNWVYPSGAYVYKPE